MVDLGLINTAIAVTGAVLGLLASTLSLGRVHLDGVVVAALVGVWWLIISVYLISFWTLVGRTPGMWLMHLRVAALDGRRPRLPQAALRMVGMVLAAIPLMAGFALVLVDDRRQGLHDKLAGTIVLYMPEDGAADMVLDETARPAWPRLRRARASRS